MICTVGEHYESEKIKRKKSKNAKNFDDLSDDAYITVTEAISFNVSPGSRATTYRYIKNQRYPVPKKISDTSSRLKVGDIRAWAKNPAEYYLRVNEPAALGKKS